MTEHDPTVPHGPHRGVRLKPEVPVVQFPDTTPRDTAHQDQTAPEATGVDPTVIDPAQARGGPNATLIDVAVPLPGVATRGPEPPHELDTDSMLAPAISEMEVPRAVEVATEDVPAVPPFELQTEDHPLLVPPVPTPVPVEPHTEHHPFLGPTAAAAPALARPKPELRTEDLPVLVPSPPLISRDHSLPESGWVAFVGPTQVEPVALSGDRRPDAQVSVLEVPTAVPEAPGVAKASDAPSARRLGAPGPKLKEIVRPAPFDPNVSSVPKEAPPGIGLPPPSRATGTPGVRPAPGPARATPTPGPRPAPPRPVEESAPSPTLAPIGPPPVTGARRGPGVLAVIVTLLLALVFGVLLGQRLANLQGTPILIPPAASR